MAAIVAAAAFAVTAGWLSPDSVDGSAVVDLHRIVLEHPGLKTAADAVTTLGSPVFVDTLCAGAAIGLWLDGRRSHAAFLVIVRAATLVGDTAIKALMQRSRPVLTHPVGHASGFSFPSGHSAGAASLYLPLALVLATSSGASVRRAAVGAAALLCLLVAASRVALGVHYPSDVIAGLALGTTFTCAAWLQLRRRRCARRNDP